MKLLGAAVAILGLALLALTVRDAVVTKRENADLKAKLKDASANVSLWQSRYAESATTVQHTTDTVRVRLTRWDTVRQTVNVHDTVSVWAALHVADSVANSCHELANACELFHHVADSTISAVGKERDAYKNLYIHERPTFWSKAKPWVFLAAGLYVGSKFRH